jgi:hypothetical protein
MKTAGYNKEIRCDDMTPAHMDTRQLRLRKSLFSGIIEGIDQDRMME